MENKLNFALKTFFWWAVITMYIYAAYDFGGIPAYASLALRLILQVVSFTLILSKDANVKRGFMYKLVIIWMIYTTLVTFINPHATRELSENLWWPCVFILFYHIAAYPRLIEKFFKKSLTKLYICAFILFPLSYTVAGFAELGATNYIFFISLLFPLLFFVKEKKRYIYYAVGLILTILAFKRSGMLIAASAGAVITWYDFIKAKGRNNGTKKIMSVFFIMAMVGVFIAINNYTGGHMSERFSNIEEDGGSGRDIIFEYVILKFQNQDSFDQIFGLGFNGVMNHEWYELRHGVFISAHSDFLEVICDFGYAGSLLYLIFIINVLINTYKIRRKSLNLYKTNVASIITFIIASMVSHLFLYPTYYAYLMIPWAITSYSLVNKRNYL